MHEAAAAPAASQRRFVLAGRTKSRVSADENMTTKLLYHIERPLSKNTKRGLMQGWTEKDKFSDMVIRSQFSPTRHKKPMTPGGRRKWSNKLPRYLIISGGGGFGQSCGLSFTDSITGHRRR